ncbi:methylamine utilization protein MauJ [Bradyrhizobium sp. F1.13.3]|uniref:methylamine utilization protein MauJ n=1 Tax=Bradyrhizobium sp. F1.13.3 TaxID=3156351 RepID=UPI0033916253
MKPICVWLKQPSELHYEHPRGEYKITLSGLIESEPELEEDLELRIILQSEGISAAEDLALNSARQFLRLLSFVTGSALQNCSQTTLMDWTPGVEHREQFAYERDDYRDRPEAITAEIFESVKELQTSPNSVAVDRALRWYSAGVSSTIMEDQFQYFWFVLELIAETTTDKLVVGDKCQKCRSDLFCPTCNEVSTHRPFQKQRIEALLTRLKVGSQIQSDLFDIRNGLMHGRAREQIEEAIQEREPDFEFAKAVDFAGQTAFMAIFNAFVIKQSQLDRLVFSAPETFVSRAGVMKAHFVIGMHGDPADPQLQNVVLPKITAHRIDETGNMFDD